jgi:hypothetical protein
LQHLELIVSELQAPTPAHPDYPHHLSTPHSEIFEKSVPRLAMPSHAPPRRAMPCLAVRRLAVRRLEISFIV